MNFLDLMDPRRRKAEELMRLQMMQQQMTPDVLQSLQQQAPGYGVLADAPMPMEAGQPGYGVLAPEANTATNQAAASGAPTFGQALPGLLSAASMFAGAGDEQPMPPPPPSPVGRPVGTKSDGLARIYAEPAESILEKRRKRRGRQ